MRRTELDFMGVACEFFCLLFVNTKSKKKALIRFFFLITWG